MGEHRPATRNNGDENRERHETLRPPHGTVLTMLFMAASPLLAVKGSKPHLNTHNARYPADRTKRVRPRNRRPDRPTAVLER